MTIYGRVLQFIIVCIAVTRNILAPTYFTYTPKGCNRESRLSAPDFEPRNSAEQKSEHVSNGLSNGDIVRQTSERPDDAVVCPRIFWEFGSLICTV